jgi:hypothetical protein
MTIKHIGTYELNLTDQQLGFIKAFYPLDGGMSDFDMIEQFTVGLIVSNIDPQSFLDDIMKKYPHAGHGIFASGA